MVTQQLKEQLAEAISAATSLDLSQVGSMLSDPKNPDFGDLAFPCFPLAKTWKLAPPECAKKLAEALSLPEGILEANPTGPFLNFYFDRERFIQDVLSQPSEPRLTKEKLVVEYSSPNIAKPFHVGHLRTTLIGNCLDRVYRRLGHDVVSVNHLGDWGTQFGFVYAGCKLWGKPEEESVAELVERYRQATTLKEQQEKDTTPSEDKDKPDVNEMARDYFRRLESDEPEAKKFWQWCIDISIRYLKDSYERLNVQFDHYTGESFYFDKLSVVEEDLRNSGVLKESQGALGVDLGEELGFARVLTPDGRSLYLTRDIAAAEYRANEFNFDRCIYVVGAPQILHFKQLIGVLHAINRDYADKIVHVPFGHVLGMKTRGEGGAIELNSFLNEAYERALNAYRTQVEKRPEGLDENEVARAVALAAIMFSNLSRTNIKDVTFSWDHALQFQGDTGPYILYAYARLNGIKERAIEANVKAADTLDSSKLAEASAYRLCVLLDRFASILERTGEEYEPNILAGYVLELAKAISKAYQELKVVGAPQEVAAQRLLLFNSAKEKLREGVELLGMVPLERM